NDPVRKYAHAPSPTTRQSSTPSDSWNCRIVIRSLMLSPHPLNARTAASYKTMHGTEAHRPAAGSTGGRGNVLSTKTRVTLRRCRGGTGYGLGSGRSPG